MERLSRGFVVEQALGWAERADRAFFDECKQFSMLHQETLALLSRIAQRTNGVAIEIGPYIGGSTVAIGSGLLAHESPTHIVVEVGGAYAHPTLPSADIIGDLRANIARYRLRGVPLL